MNAIKAGVASGVDFLKSLWRAVQKWAEPKPILGLVFITPLAKHLRALWHALVTACLGSIGLWLTQATIAMEHEKTLRMHAVFANIGQATQRGEMLILVPALLAPLYLLFTGLADDRSMRKHQLWILTGSAVLGGFTLWVYVTKIASGVADNNFLQSASWWSIFITLGLLYLYFLQSHLSSEDAVHSLQDKSNPMVTELERRYKEQSE